MAKLTRKQLLKGGAVGAAAAAALPLAGTAALAGSDEAVHIHGTVTHPTLGAVEISIDAAGRRDDLSGAGWDDDPAPGVAGACYFTQAGSRDGDTITLMGRVLFSNTSGFLNAPVTTTADRKSGAITFDFAGFIFTGTGVVTVD